MSGNHGAAARILAAQALHCEQMAEAVSAARAAGRPAAELEDLEAQELAAKRRYQELAVDMPTGVRTGRLGGGRHPWWRFW